VLKATQVDGVYTADPKTDPNAKRYDSISYDEVIQRQLRVMDLTAVALAKENNIPILVFSQHTPNALEDIIQGKGSFTIIKN
jgi:uridylate kinase